MQYILKKFEAITTQEDEISKFHEYRFPFKHASLGVSEIHGRYPKFGFDIDEEIEQCWYVESGSAIIYVGQQEFRAEDGDMIYIPMGEKYWIKGENLKLVVASAPPWFPEQHKHTNGISTLKHGDFAPTS